MTTTRWWWVRHAPVTGTGGRIYGQNDPPCDVSDAPVFEALALALPPRAVLVISPLQRTRQTADAICEAGLALPAPLVELALAEQHFGEWQGRTHREISAEARHVHWLAPASLKPPGGESFVEVMARVHRAIARLTKDHTGRDIVAIAHGGPIRAALALAIGLDGEQALAFSIDVCSLTRIDHIKTRDAGTHWAVRCVNWTTQGGVGAA